MEEDILQRLIFILFSDVHQQWIDEKWGMVKPGDPVKTSLADIPALKHGGTVASMLIGARGFWAHDYRENLLQEEEPRFSSPSTIASTRLRLIKKHRTYLTGIIDPIQTEIMFCN